MKSYTVCIAIVLLIICGLIAIKRKIYLLMTMKKDKNGYWMTYKKYLKLSKDSKKTLQIALIGVAIHILVLGGLYYCFNKEMIDLGKNAYIVSMALSFLLAYYIWLVIFWNKRDKVTGESIMLEVTHLKKDDDDYYFVTENGNTVNIKRVQEDEKYISYYLVGKIKLSAYDINEETKDLIYRMQEEKILEYKTCKISISEDYIWLKCYLYSNYDGYDVKYSTYIDVKTCEFIKNTANRIEELWTS